MAMIMTSAPQKRGRKPVRRLNAQTKKVSAKEIITRYLPDAAVVAVGALAIIVMLMVYPGTTNVIVVSAMGAAFITCGLMGLLR